MRALVLFTGGLDSQLAVRLLQQQSIEVTAIYYRAPFAPVALKPQAAAERLGIPLLVVDLSDAYARFLREPRLGFVRGAAACLDCRVAMLREAREQMEQVGARFVCAGDVVGQRARTAVRDFEVVDHHAGVADQVLRPLSAQLLPSTAMERDGTIDRRQLLALQGKARRAQLRLADELKIDIIPPPRADCPLLSEPLASRVLAAVKRPIPPQGWQLRLLAIGRTHDLPAGGWCVIARNEEDGKGLRQIVQLDVAASAVFLEPDGFVGPCAVVVAADNDTDVQHAAGLLLRYSRNRPPAARVIAQRGTNRWIVLLDDVRR